MMASSSYVSLAFVVVKLAFMAYFAITSLQYPAHPVAASLTPSDPSCEMLDYLTDPTRFF